MGFGLVSFQQIGPADKPSPSIWADCPGNDLNDTGVGIFRHHEFLVTPLVTTTITSALLGRLTVDGLQIDGDDDTVVKQGTVGEKGVLHLETDGDDNDAAAVFSAPFGKIAKNSGKKLWLEVYAAPGDDDADMSTFFGLTELAGLSRDVLADDAAADGLITESVIGFLQDNGDDNAYDIVYRKDAGTVVTVLANSTNSPAITAQGGTVAAVVADTFHKYGLKFDGNDKLDFFVDGYKVATQTVDSTIDQSKLYGFILAIKTGTGAAEDIKAGWVRYAAQEDNV